MAFLNKKVSIFIHLFAISNSFLVTWSMKSFLKPSRFPWEHRPGKLRVQSYTLHNNTTIAGYPLTVSIYSWVERSNLWLSVLLKNTNTTTSMAEIRTHIMPYISHIKTKQFTGLCLHHSKKVSSFWCFYY